MINEEPSVMTVRITKKMRELLEKAVTSDTHLNESEYVRDAIREKLQKQGLYK